jgi:hypothetical protein
MGAVVRRRRRDVKTTGGHFRTPTVLPVIGCICSLYLVTRSSGRPSQQHVRGTAITDSTQLADAPD